MHGSEESCTSSCHFDNVKIENDDTSSEERDPSQYLRPMIFISFALVPYLIMDRLRWHKPLLVLVGVSYGPITLPLCETVL